MNKQAKISGVILAGGLARRMNKQDKGLVDFNGQPMIRYALDAMLPVVDELLINANRSHEQYQAFGYPIIQDENSNFDGPLAGVYAGLNQCINEVLLVIPCDSPFITPEGLNELLLAREQHDAEVAVAFDGERLHPVFFAVKASLKESLKDYLALGERKIDRWIMQHDWVKVDFSAHPEFFENINTLEQLQALAKK